MVCKVCTVCSTVCTRGECCAGSGGGRHFWAPGGIGLWGAPKAQGPKMAISRESLLTQQHPDPKHSPWRFGKKKPSLERCAWRDGVPHRHPKVQKGFPTRNISFESGLEQHFHRVFDGPWFGGRTVMPKQDAVYTSHLSNFLEVKFLQKVWSARTFVPRE